MTGMKKVLTVTAAAAFAFGIAGIHAQSGYSAQARNGAGIVDADGDGICDITGQAVGSGVQAGKQAGKGKQKGPGNGTGNQGNRPEDGTGYGAQSGKRTGPQDGSQAHIGQGNRSGNGGQSSGNPGRRGGRW